MLLLSLASELNLIAMLLCCRARGSHGLLTKGRARLGALGAKDEFSRWHEVREEGRLSSIGSMD